MKQRLCKVTHEKGGRRGRKKGEEQAQGVREHGNKVLPQERPKYMSLLVKALGIWGTSISGMHHSKLPFGYCTVSFPLFFKVLPVASELTFFFTII